MLALYEVVLDRAGELLSYRETRRYRRGCYDDLDMFGGLDDSALPSRRQRILATIRDWVAADGCTPSTRQIGEAGAVVGVAGPTQSRNSHISPKASGGRLVRSPGRPHLLDLGPRYGATRSEVETVLITLLRAA